MRAFRRCGSSERGGAGQVSEPISMFMKCPRCGLTLRARARWMAARNCPRCAARSRQLVALAPVPGALGSTRVAAPEARSAAGASTTCEHCPPGLFAGIRWPAWPDDCGAPAGWSWVEHCEHCEEYPDDEAAALALNEIGFGTRFQWFDRHTHEPRQLSEDKSASLAIDFPEQWRESAKEAEAGSTGGGSEPGLPGLADPRLL